MTYQAPDILELGPVAELTFGGFLVPAFFDHITGYIFHLPPPPPDDRAA
jgi:hypothetical protein